MKLLIWHDSLSRSHLFLNTADHIDQTKSSSHVHHMRRKTTHLTEIYDLTSNACEVSLQNFLTQFSISVLSPPLMGLIAFFQRLETTWALLSTLARSLWSVGPFSQFHETFQRRGKEWVTHGECGTLISVSFDVTCVLSFLTVKFAESIHLGLLKEIDWFFYSIIICEKSLCKMIEYFYTLLTVASLFVAKIILKWDLQHELWIVCYEIFCDQDFRWENF